MPTLKIVGFSCIEAATVELQPITIFIGPQASGKSIIAKLLYFFPDIIHGQHRNAEDGESLKQFKRHIQKRFGEWFPPQAWGKRSFTIVYEAGDIKFTLSRKATSKRSPEEVTVDTSEFFDSQYNSLLANYRRVRKRQPDDDLINFSAIDKSWEIRASSVKSLKNVLKGEYIDSQLFIPAGRSFFTTLGRAVAMLEHGSQLDKITKSFGRLFTSLLDRDHVYFYGGKTSTRLKEFIEFQKKVALNLFGGELKLSVNDQHVSTPDGRKIPLSSLSSGQQELLPLLLILRHFVRGLGDSQEKSSNLLYIEEPEAHLFPRAQGALVEYMAAISNFLRSRVSMVITTHSPYVLSKLNILIKAHAVSSLVKDSDSQVDRVVVSRSWLPPAAVAAYALSDGTLINIKDDSGLIDGAYLDEISDEISESFMELLSIEVNS